MSSLQALNSSPALVFLHFWGGSSSIYAPLITLLSSNYYCLALDFRGWGSSTGPQDPDVYHIKDLSNDVFTPIPETFSPNHPFILIGHSMGGKVAMHLSYTIGSLSPTKSFPRLQALILLAPAPPTPLILPEEMAKQQLAAYDSIEAATFVIIHVLSSSLLPKRVVSSLATNALAGNQYAKAAWPKYGMQENILEEAMNIALPTLVFAGGMIRLKRQKYLGKQVAEERKSLMVLDGIGHLIMLEAPDKLSREIQKFDDGVMHVVGQIKD